MQIVGGDGKPLTAYQQTYHWRVSRISETPLLASCADA
jgi:hypothetical protein